MVVARRRWRQEQHSMERGRLIFLDETWVNASMTRRYGCSARGARRLASVPHGHWHTNTFLAGLRHDGVQAPWLLDGPLNGEAFLAYIQHVLGPTLQPGDIVIADNLSSHKVVGVKEALAQWGASIIYLPPYSQDLNPIENFFSLNSRPCSEELQSAPSTRLLKPSLQSSTPLPLRRVLTTSMPQVMFTPNSKTL